MATSDELGIDVSSHGDVPEQERVYAEEKLANVAKLAPGRILHARLRLMTEADPARERPAIVKGSIDVDGRVVRAHVAAPTMHEAIDWFEERMRDRLGHLAERARSLQLRHRDAGPGEWHHGDAPTTRRPELFDRPVDEREIVRRKEFAVEAETPDEAVFDMESLHHDFFLFTDVETDEENVVYRVPGGGYEIVQPTPTPDSLARCAAPVRLGHLVPARLRVDDAIELLGIGNEPFVFFIDADTGRGNVVYRRYDGHYGLITPVE